VRWPQRDPPCPYTCTDRLGETLADLDLAPFPDVGNFRTASIGIAPRAKSPHSSIDLAGDERFSSKSYASHLGFGRLFPMLEGGISRVEQRRQSQANVIDRYKGALD
jgi:hypothetical protein